MALSFTIFEKMKSTFLEFSVRAVGKVYWFLYRKYPNEFKGHYNTWQKNRLNLIQSFLSESYKNSLSFKSFKALELGAGHGFFSEKLSELGFTCVAAEGRAEHISWMNKNLTFLTQGDGYVTYYDGDNPKLEEKNFNVVIHFGLLYHLRDPLANLKWCLTELEFDIMFLETEVCNFSDQDMVLFLEEKGYDQAMNGIGGRPSVSIVENLFLNLGYSFKRIDSKALDSIPHVYSWDSDKTPYSWFPGMRRFWVIYGKDLAPL
jgi:hypothetical protein